MSMSSWATFRSPVQITGFVFLSVSMWDLSCGRNVLILASRFLRPSPALTTYVLMRKNLSNSTVMHLPFGSEIPVDFLTEIGLIFV